MKIPTLGKITPYEIQWKVIQSTLSHIREQMAEHRKGGEVKHAVIEAAVSSGKTIIMAAIANYCESVKHKCLIMTNIGELAGQNLDECWNMDASASGFSNYLGTKSTYFATREGKGGTVVGTSGTIVNRLDEDFSDIKFSVVLIDECHTLNFNNEDSQFIKIINHLKAINPALVVIGLSGTPYREGATIIGDFWQTQILPKVDAEYLADNNYTHRHTFGFTDNEYDLGDDFGVSEDEHSTSDFSDAQLGKMHKLMDLSLTHKIGREVVELTKDRNGVLITCAGLSHCKEISEVLPHNSWAIVTSKDGVVTNTKFKKRKEVTDAFKSGEIKFLIQIGCYSTGFNSPLCDTVVLLRRIHSLTLFTQILGRPIRLLKKEQLEAGVIKNDALVLDYSGTTSALWERYNNPVLAEAAKAKDKFEQNLIECPECGDMVGEHTRRCDCGHWLKFRLCESFVRGGKTISKGCGEKNDITSKECRSCGNTLIDPNAKLERKHYSVDDWIPVKSKQLEVIGKEQDGMAVKYFLDSFDDAGNQEVANVKYWSINTQNGKRAYMANLCQRHINDYKMAMAFARMKPINAVKNKAMLDTPTFITHRINDKGNSVVHGLRFASGREMKGSKKS